MSLQPHVQSPQHSSVPSHVPLLMQPMDQQGSAMASSSEPKNEQEIIARFQEMRQQVAETISKIADLEAEAAEHELVIKTLRPMETDRKCYRLVGDVLVQRTVAETLPAVERNKAGLDDILSKLRQQQERMQKQLEEFQAR